MGIFPIVKANEKSLRMRSSVLGIGVNDAEYMTSININGKEVKCPAYKKWHSMLDRCYNKKTHSKYPSYLGCSVCFEWLTFSNFLKWFHLSYVEGWELDKDIKVNGNKVYSPETCLFVPSCINSLLLRNDNNRGSMPIGVCANGARGNFRSQLSVDGKKKYLGDFATKEEASKEYNKAKNIEIMRKIKQYPDFECYLINNLT